jgi:hypothetical protein
LQEISETTHRLSSEDAAVNRSGLAEERFTLYSAVLTS